MKTQNKYKELKPTFTVKVHVSGYVLSSQAFEEGISKLLLLFDPDNDN